MLYTLAWVYFGVIIMQNMNLVVIEDTYLTVKYQKENEWLEDEKANNDEEEQVPDDAEAPTSLQGMYVLSATSQNGEMDRKTEAGGRRLSVGNFAGEFSKNILKALITKDSVTLHKKQSEVVYPIVQAKPLERKEVEQALALDTKLMSDHKKELVDYSKLKRFKVSLIPLFTQLFVGHGEGEEV